MAIQYPSQLLLVTGDFAGANLGRPVVAKQKLPVGLLGIRVQAPGRNVIGFIK